MKYKYDKETDVMLIELSGQKPDFAKQNGNVITHYDKQGVPTEIEILSAQKTILEMVKAIKTAK